MAGLLLALLLLAVVGCGPRDATDRITANPPAAPTAAGGVNPAPQSQPAPSPTATAAAPTTTATIAIAATATARPPAAKPAIAATTNPPAKPTPTLATETTPSLIQLADPLDEPEFYCVDVPGFRDSLRTDHPLQAHTCKPGAADELFTAHQPSTGQFLMPAYNLCIAAEGKQVYTRPCTDHPAQRFVHHPDGTISAAESDLCLAVAVGSGEPAGGRSHVRRDLGLLPCGEVAAELSQWVLPGRETR